MPIVVLTGEEADELALQAVKAGAEDYICKSELEPKLLLRTIRYAIERAAQRRTEEKLGQMERDYRQADAALSDHPREVPCLHLQVGSMVMPGWTRRARSSS